MASKYHKNGILTGSVDYYCLVCESYLRTEDDLCIHITKPIHKKNLDSTVYLEKFKNECVRKVKKGYFCEFCNVLLSTPTKVGLHVAEEKHIHNKGTQLLKRVGNAVIAFEDVLLNERAWNGLIDDTCALCNTELDNELIHKTEPSHILNLIQNEVEFGVDKSIYRKIDESSFQCLTCNMVLATTSFAIHFALEEHKKLYELCRQSTLDIKKEKNYESNKNQDSKVTTVKESIVMANSATQKAVDNVKKTETILENEKKPAIPLEAVKKPAISLEAVKKPAIPEASTKKTGIPLSEVKPAIPVETAKKPTAPIESAMKSERPRGKLEKVTSELDDEICQALGAKDYITYDENGKQWCILCDWTMENCVTESHVVGRHHQTMLKMHKERLQRKLKSKEITKEATNPETKENKKDKEAEVSPAEQENKSKILDSVSKFQKNDINVNFETGTAVCKKCTKNIDFVYDTIENHIEEHKKKPAKKDVAKPAALSFGEQNKNNAKKSLFSSPVRLKRSDSEDKSETRASSAASTRETDEEAEKFAKENDLIYNLGSTKVYCPVCESKVPFYLKNMKEHMAGMTHHKNKSARALESKQNLKSVIVKQPMGEFIKTIIAVENGFMKDVILNEKFCINVLSFMMITKYDFRLRCQACEVNLNIDQIDMHKATPNHEKAMCETMIVTSLESEFVREVKPGLYHCGYCNLVEEGQEDLDSHMKCTSHRESKTSANWRLQQYMPGIMQNQQQKQMEMVFLMRMLMRGDPF